MPSKELNILIIACRLYLDTSKIEDWKAVTDDTSLDWERAFDLAAWHNIRPIFFEALRQYKPDTVPSELLQNLTSFCRQLTVGTLSKLVQLKELTENFEQENIQLVLHKGIHYASFYKSLSHREFGDIDVLIMEKDLEKATELMQKTGYKLYHDYDSLKNITKIDYHLIFDSKNATSPVEIHWKPNILSSFTAFDSLQIQKINNVYFPVPSSEDTLILMSLHHGQKENWDKLKYLLDLQLASLDNKQQFSSELNKGLDLLGLFNSNPKMKEAVDNWILQAESITSIESTKANAEKDLATWPQKIFERKGLWQASSVPRPSGTHDLDSPGRF